MSPRLALLLVAVLLASSVASAQTNPRLGISDDPHAGSFHPSLDGGDYDFTLTAQPASGETSVVVSFRYTTAVQPETRIYWGLGKASDEESTSDNLVGTLPSANPISVRLNHAGQTYHIRVAVTDDVVEDESYQTKLEVKASRPGNSLAAAPAILYPFTFCYSVDPPCGDGGSTTTTSTAASTTTTASTPSSTSSSVSASSSPSPSASSSPSPSPSASSSPSPSPTPSGNPPTTPNTSSSSSSSSASQSSSPSTASSTSTSTSGTMTTSSSATSTTGSFGGNDQTPAAPDVDAHITRLSAIPDTDGGVMVSWAANPGEEVGSFLVWRLSAPVLLATLPVEDVDEDGLYRFYDESLPEGTHHYVIQARARGSTVTVFDEDGALSNGVRRVFVVDLGCLATEPDTDGDGLCDRVEQAIGTNVLLADTDGDGLSDFEELKGTKEKDGVPTNPFSKDTNGDGITDAESISRGINPTGLEASEVKGWSTGKVVLLVAAGVIIVVAGIVLLGRGRKPGK